jgi:hyperosmotically inducible protein
MMNFNRVTPRFPMLALALASALAAPYAAAVDEPSRKLDNPKFTKLDKNGDGFVSQDEVRHLKGYQNALTEADDNKDGKLDRDEFVKAESIYERMLVGRYASDSVITAKVKAALLKEKGLKSTDVSVETLRGEVLLSGFVRDEDQRDKAKQVATQVAGVTSVRDAMVLR